MGTLSLTKILKQGIQEGSLRVIKGVGVIKGVYLDEGAGSSRCARNIFWFDFEWFADLPSLNETSED